MSNNDPESGTPATVAAVGGGTVGEVILGARPGSAATGAEEADAAIELTGLVGAVSLTQPATGAADLEQPAAGDSDNSEDS